MLIQEKLVIDNTYIASYVLQITNDLCLPRLLLVCLLRAYMSHLTVFSKP